MALLSNHAQFFVSGMHTKLKLSIIGRLQRVMIGQNYTSGPLILGKIGMCVCVCKFKLARTQGTHLRTNLPPATLTRSQAFL